MQLKKLDNSFYSENSHLKEALDNHNGSWAQGKIRGYGIVLITINHLSFAIPLRTNIKHRSSYIIVKSRDKNILGKGLDFTKALLISDRKYISNLPFKIPPTEHKKLVNKELHITQKFEKYVQKYIDATRKSDTNILGSVDYRFSTLCNYHAELNLL